jgi:hypothetical protein
MIAATVYVIHGQRESFYAYVYQLYDLTMDGEKVARDMTSEVRRWQESRWTAQDGQVVRYRVVLPSDHRSAAC